LILWLLDREQCWVKSSIHRENFGSPDAKYRMRVY
jgi:hypothetical protein